MLGELLGVASGVAGMLTNRSAAKKQQELNERARQEDYAHQKEFAQSGIQWKVADAKAAGIHPAIALGAQPASFSPIGVGDTGTQHLAASGQDLSRAIDSTRTAFSRTSAFDQTVQGLTVQKMGLENELLASQIAQVKQQVGPPMSSVDPNTYRVPGQTASGLELPVPLMHSARQPQFTPNIRVAGRDWLPHPGWSDAQTFEDRYGEMSDYLAGPAILASDWFYNNRNSRWNPFNTMHVDPKDRR